MSKMKIYELAKEIEKPSKEIVGFLKEKGIEVKSHMSNLEDGNIELVKKHFANSTENVKTVEKAKVVEKGKAVETAKVADKKIINNTNDNTSKRMGNNNRMDKNTNNTNNTANNTNNSNTNRTNATSNTNANRTNNANSNNTNVNRTNNANSNNTNVNRTNNTNSNNTNVNRTNNTNSNNTNVNRTNNTNNTNNNRNSNYKGNNNNTNTSANRTNNSTSNTTNANSNNRNYSNTNRTNSSNTSNNTTNGNTTNRNYSSNNTANGANRNSTNGTSNGTGSTNGTNNSLNNRTNNNNNNNNNNNRNNNNNSRGGRGGYNNSRGGYNNRNTQAPKKYKDPNRKGAFIMPDPIIPAPEEEVKTITLPETLTIKDLADKMKMPVSAIVKKLFLEDKMVTPNEDITFEEAEEIALGFDIIAEEEIKVDIIEELLKEEEEDEATMVKRPPVVCVMGHVDHGKTSLLDAIRKTSVTVVEAGGITQHIGASVVKINGEKITFLDTPGHEAFTSMRMRGAQSTDIAILVVAADDGVMPQTIEAINHAKAAGVEIIVAVNKMDKPSANIERVKQELVEHELVAEDWGGDTIFVPVSAHTGDGIEQLLEMILLTAEVCELKANPNRKARGIVIEAELDKGRGSVATVLVQKGTLRVGDSIAIGSAFGKVRAMLDDKGRRVKEAGPSMPVEILGLNDVPDAGEILMEMDNEKEARSIAEAFIKQGREKLLKDTKSRLSLDGLFSQIQAGNIKELNLVVKADVQGSVEAVKQSLLKLTNEEVAIRIIHGGVGAINESDVILASASNAIIIGFNVRPDSTAKETAERENVDLRLYRVIYNAIEDIEAAMKGMLDPIYAEKITGHAEVRKIFKASGLGTIAGSYVLDGKILRGSSVRITREGKLVFEGELASLKIVKDDVKEVNAKYECGLVFEKFNDVEELDIVEAYIMEEVPR